jgi:hypothetical protein
MTLDAAFRDLRGNHRTEAVPPETHCLVADDDAAFDQQILYLTQRQWIPDIHHHRQLGDLGRAVQISEGISHPRRLSFDLIFLNPVCSDTAPVLVPIVRINYEQSWNLRPKISRHSFPLSMRGRSRLGYAASFRNMSWTVSPVFMQAPEFQKREALHGCWATTKPR